MKSFWRGILTPGILHMPSFPAFPGSEERDGAEGSCCHTLFITNAVHCSFSSKFELKNKTLKIKQQEVTAFYLEMVLCRSRDCDGWDRNPAERGGAVPPQNTSTA